MTSLAVFAVVALVVAGPDLVTVGGVVRTQLSLRRGVPLWLLPGVVVAAHAGLVVAALVAS